jgi:benzoyl-CoA reductase subunit D
MISAGIDMGTQRVKVAIIKDKQIVAQAQKFAGFEPTKAAEQALKEALESAKLSREDIQHITATGASVNMATFADSTISMMGADAKAGAYFFPSTRTVIDVGAEDARAVKCDDHGIMQDFVVNARCAAGAGTFVEAMARALEVELDDMGPLSLKAERASPINASCVIFAESDVVSLIHKEEPKSEIARAIFDAMTERVASMARRLGVSPDVVLVGGAAKDIGFVESLKRRLGIELLIPEEPIYAGAVGAALVAAKRAKRRQ